MKVGKSRRVIHLFRDDAAWGKVKKSFLIKVVHNHALITRLVDGPEVGVWVIPAEATNIGFIRHLLSGVPDRVHYVEFDVTPDELRAPTGLLKRFFACWQKVIVTNGAQLKLRNRNPGFGTLPRRALPWAFEAFKREPGA